MAFRIQDLMTDVFPAWQMANPRCTCQISAEIQREPAALPGEEPENAPNEEVDCHETLLPSGDCPPAEEELLAVSLVALRRQLLAALEA